MSYSFEPSTNLDDSSTIDVRDNRQILQPHAPPPSAPPPPLPESANNSRSSSPIQQQQQHAYSTFGSQQQQLPPGITIVNYNYESSPASKQGKRTVSFPPDANGLGPQLEHPSNTTVSNNNNNSLSWFRGDATLRPNIGESNAAVGEASLRESLWKGQVVNVVACTFAILLQFLDFIRNVLFLHPARTVLGMYLALFSMLVLCFETGLGRDIVRRQLGLLHHPIGRSFILLLMSGLAIGQAGILDILLGIVFFWSSVYTIVTFCWYPAYRRRISQDGGEEERRSILVTARDHFWANPAEATSLLQKAIVTRV